MGEIDEGNCKDSENFTNAFSYSYFLIKYFPEINNASPLLSGN